ncbi:MAG: hypothetical protein Q4P15_00670 [Propionibacteriaceae bacterium]|nr:hypothetical protein [Propionibacteriaceae bacterium]
MTADAATENTDTSAQSKDASRLGWSAGVSSTVWVFAFLILRIFAVSGYSWETAFLVSTTISLNDGLAILFGSLMADHLLVAILLMFVLPLLIAALLWGPSGRRLVMSLAAVMSLVILVTITASFRTWWLPMAAAAVLFSFLMIRRLPREHPLRQVWGALLVRASAVAGAAVLVVAAFLQTPWVPHEQIETTDETISGHVLSVDSGYLNVLTDDHEFLILISGDVISRK